MPYPDDYTSRGAPDEGAKPFDLPVDHPFSGYSEQELGKVANALDMVRATLSQASSARRGVPVTEIRDHLEGFLSELRDYVDTLDTRLTEAFDSFGD